MDHDGDGGNDDDVTPNITFHPPLYMQRDEKLLTIIKSSDAISKVLELGCGECRFLKRLKKLDKIVKIDGIDCIRYLLEDNFYMLKPLNLDYLIPRQNPLTVRLFCGDFLQADLSSLIDTNQVVILSEVIEHIEESNLPKLSQVVFLDLNPDLVIISTPNADFNVCFNNENNASPNFKFRHSDHKFEWTRQEFSNWCQMIVSNYSYDVTFDGVGEPPKNHSDVGYCTQFAIFNKKFTEPINCLGNVINVVPSEMCLLELVNELTYPYNSDDKESITDENIENEMSYVIFKEIKWLLQMKNYDESRDGYLDGDLVYISIDRLYRNKLLKKYFDENNVSTIKSHLIKMGYQLRNDKFLEVKNPTFESNSSDECSDEDEKDSNLSESKAISEQFQDKNDDDCWN